MIGRGGIPLRFRATDESACKGGFLLTACMGKANRILLALLLLALLPAAGCLSSHRAVVADVDPLEWRDGVQVRFTNADTLSECDLRFVVRYDAAFAGDPVDLEVTTVAPDSLRLTETFALRLAPSHGHSPLLRDTAVLYRRRAVLRREGEYRMTIRPSEPVRGIEAVGITIEKSE